MNENPDDFWPWRTHHIDEKEWEINQALRPHEPTGPWWYLLGAVIGILLAVMT